MRRRREWEIVRRERGEDTYICVYIEREIKGRVQKRGKKWDGDGERGVEIEKEIKRSRDR